MNEKTSVGALDVTDALEETTEFVCEAGLPSGAMNVGFDKVTIFEDVASDVVNDGPDEICCGLVVLVVEGVGAVGPIL